jgi:hypothetical protein
MKCHVRKRLQTVLERKPDPFVFRTTLRLKSLLLGMCVVGCAFGQISGPSPPTSQAGRYAVSRYSAGSVVSMNTITAGVLSTVYISHCYPIVYSYRSATMGSTLAALRAGM